MRKFSLIITAVTPAQAASPAFREALLNWRQLADNVAVVAARGTSLPAVPYVFVHETPDAPMLHDVIAAVPRFASDTRDHVCLADAYALLSPDILSIPDLAAERQLGLAWIGASSAIMSDGLFEPLGLRVFVACRQIFDYAERHCPKSVPFVWPLWSGWFAHMATHNSASGKYFDFSMRRTVTLLDGPADLVPPFDLPAVYNPPVKSY